MNLLNSISVNDKIKNCKILDSTIEEIADLVINYGLSTVSVPSTWRKGSNLANFLTKLAEKSIESAQHFTEPPLRYDEASLIKFLEEMGIGRPSTYTPIITVILSRGYVTREGKFLKPTALGEVTTQVMNEHFPEIVDYKFTANMENNLDTIENGNITMQDVLGSFYKDFTVSLSKANDLLQFVYISQKPPKC